MVARGFRPYRIPSPWSERSTPPLTYIPLTPVESETQEPSAVIENNLNLAGTKRKENEENDNTNKKKTRIELIDLNSPSTSGEANVSQNSKETERCDEQGFCIGCRYCTS